VVELHTLIARALVLYFALLGVWGVFLGLRKRRSRELDPSFRGAVAIGVALGVIQAFVGVVLVASGLRPADNLHYLYGASVIVTLPLVSSYIADKQFSRPLAYGLATLFMAGLAIRAITTGGSV
jgi:heme A synthase